MGNSGKLGETVANAGSRAILGGGADPVHDRAPACSNPHVLKSVAQSRDHCPVGLNIGQAFCV
jgi:hypothetical protein